MYIQKKDLKYQDWAFAQRKNLPYEEKVKLAIRRIEEWNEFWEGQVYLSFSGGLDSTVLLALIRMTLGKEVPAVFCNTGLEYPEIVSFARKAALYGAFEEIRPKKNFRQVILDEGYPVITKENAAKIRKLRHGNLSERYRNYLLNGDERGKFGMLPKKWQRYIEAPFEICSVYKEVKRNLQGYYQLTGEQRTGCMYCCFGVNQEEEPNRFQRMMLTHPKCYAFCMKAVEKGGLGLKDVLRYMEIPYETWESVGQMCLNFDEDRIA
jgi:hypothetical protein